MAWETAEDARKSILEDGFFLVRDPQIGERVKEMEGKGFPYASEYGLDFCKVNVLDDRVRTILESFFDWSGLGLYRTFGRDPDHNFLFMNRATTEMQVLVVQLWSNGSRVRFWGRSQLHALNGIAAANGLLEVPSGRLEGLGLQPTEVVLERGGLALLDARLAFNIIEGFAITFAFATQEELRTWSKMRIPKQIDRLDQKMAEMESKHIGVNFAFEKSG
ncbi:hypothetical protein N656DRAFT_720756 [Canariomyces notabilis]|uniref:Uncharacterized protein n=1 Tax=Canariomyces notabilis TaxID=2074819 RepID=A0AAN6QH45_9PEZI|nr:hypothetical protein N656DRAFT_720756 [Canariomyces arenarius]